MNQQMPSTSTEGSELVEISGERVKKSYKPVTPEKTAELVKLTSKQKIDSLLEDIKKSRELAKDVGDKEKIPIEERMVERLAGISGLEFLNYSPEDLRLLFTEGDTVNFHENESAYRAIGASDLFCDEKNQHTYVKVNDKVGKITMSSVYGSDKIGYEDSSGNYLGIKTGSGFDLGISVTEIEEFEKEAKTNEVSFEELDFTTPKDGEEETEAQKRIRETKESFKEKFHGIDEGYQEDSWEKIEYSGSIPESHMNEAAKVISKAEGFRGEAYYDINGYAIGYGTHKVERNGKLILVTKDMTITKEEAISLLPRTIERHVKILRQRIDVTKITPNQFAALSSLAYNYGPGFFGQKRGTKILNALKNDNVAEAAGLVRSLSANKGRRATEAELLIS